jgi:hypothetical protein
VIANETVVNFLAQWQWLVEVDDTFQLVGMQDLVTRRVGQVGLRLGGVIWTILR